MREGRAGWRYRSVSRWRAWLTRVPHIPEPRHTPGEGLLILADAEERRFLPRTGYAAREIPREFVERAGGGFTRGETRNACRILRRAVEASRRRLAREMSGKDKREGGSRSPVQGGKARLSGGR